MAYIVIMAVSAAHADPDIDTRFCYKRGDIVAVLPDGWEFGSREVIPPAEGGPFVHVRITDVTPEQVRTVLQARWGLAADSEEIEGGETVRRRALRVLVDALPAGVKSQLWNTGTYETTWAAIRSFVQRKLGEDIL